MTAPSFAPGRSRSAPSSAQVLSDFHLVRQFNLFTDLLPVEERHHAFPSRFRCLVALTSQSLVEEALLICLRRVQGSRWYHFRQNLGSLPSQCSVGNGRASSARWPLCQRSRVMRLHLRRSCRLPGVVRFVFSRRILTSHSQGPKVQISSWSVCFARSFLALFKACPHLPHVAFSSLKVRSRLLHLPSVSSANVSHTLAVSGISRLMLRRLRRPFLWVTALLLPPQGLGPMKKVDPKIVRQRSLLDVSWPPRAGSEPVQIVKMTMVHITHGIMSTAPPGTKVR